MDIEVRDARIDDAAALGSIHVAAWQAAYRGIMSDEFLDAMSPDRAASNWTRILTGEHSDDAPAAWDHLVAVRSGQVTAMAAVGPPRDANAGSPHAAPFPPAQLWMLNAHPTVFGTGTAAVLHAVAVQRIGARGHSSAYLWVARDNPRARRFYERQGWTSDGLEQTDQIGGAEVAEVRYSRHVP